jgi:hypothetical protein
MVEVKIAVFWGLMFAALSIFSLFICGHYLVATLSAAVALYHADSTKKAWDAQFDDDFNDR